MAFDNHANLALDTVATAPSPATSGTSLTVNNGALFPAAPFNVTVWPTGVVPTTTNAEIVRVTSKGTGNNWTIVRTQEGTSARAIQVGDQIANTITVKVITDIEAAIPSTAGLISAVNVSAGTTSNNLSALTFSNSNGVSFGLSGSVITGTVATNYQSQGAYLTTAMRSDAVTLSNINVSAGTTSNLLSALTFSNGNGVSFGLNGSTLTGSIATSLTNVNVSAGTTSNNLSAFVLSNSNNVSFGLNGSTVTATVTVASTQGSINVSAGTTSNIASAFTFSNSNGISFGLNASTITASYTVPTVTAGSDTAGISNLGNTSGTSGVVSGDAIRVLFAGGNNITLSQSLNGASATITISGANVGGAQTGISGIGVSDTTYTSGTVIYSAQANVTLGSSVNGASQYVRISANPAQTNQSAIKAFGASNTGNTSGNTGVSTGIDWVLAGTNQATISESTAVGGPNTLWVNVTTAAQTVESQSIGMSNLGNTSGTTGVASGGQVRALFAGGNNITISQSVNGASATLTISAFNQTNQSAIKGFGASNTGNTAGNTGLSTGIDWVLAGSNNVTISQSTTAGGPNTLWVSGPTVGGAQTGISGIVASDATYTSGTVYVSGQANITVGSSTNGASQYVRLSVAAQSNQSAIQALGVSNTGNTAGNTGVSTGINFVIAGSNGITASQSTTAGGPNTIWLSGVTTAAQTNQSAIKGLGVSNTGNTAGNTGLSTGIDWVIAGSNGITASESTTAGGPNTVWISGVTTAAQSNQTVGLYAVGNTTGQSSSSTFDARTVSFDGAGIASVGFSGGSVVVSVPSGGGGLTNINVSAGTTSNLLSALTFADSNGVSWGLNASTITATVSTYSTVGTATTVKAVASANSVGTITRWAAEDHAHAGIGAVGISTAGNTLGTTGSEQGTYWFQGSNGVTLSQITSNNGSHTLVVMNAPPISYYERVPLFNTQTMTVSGSTSYVMPFDVPEALSCSYLRLPVSMSANSTSWSSTTANTAYSASLASTLYAVVYSRGTGGSSQSLQSVASATAGLSQQWSFTAGAQATRYTISYNVTYPITGGTSNLSTNVAVSNASIQVSSNSVSDFTGLRFLDLPLATFLQPGNYWVAVGMSSATSTQGVANFTQANITFSHLVVTQINASIGLMGTASNSSLMARPGLGSFTTNAIGTTASIPLANVSSSASHGVLPLQLIRIT